MRRKPGFAAIACVAAASCAVAALASGCGIGPGPASPGEATLTVTRDYGSERLAEATESDPKESETVIRFLDRETELETRYGGGFVQSIDGLAGTFEDGRSYDWFFYVNGIESPVGSAEVGVLGGDRIWWDYRDWTDAMRVPAVVGSWPEPFLQRSTEDAKRLPVRVECSGDPEPCKTVRDRLADEGVNSATVKPGEAGGQAMRILVGTWSELGSSPEGKLIDNGPQTSGVFAAFSADGSRLQSLDPQANATRTLEEGSGLVAAERDGDDPPVWLVTGTDDKGVAAAAELLESEHLRDRFALAVDPAGELPLPADPAGPGG